MRKNKVFDFWFKKQYVIAGCLVLFAAFGMTALYSHNQEQERERLEQEIAQNAEESNQVAEAEDPAENASSVVPPKQETPDSQVEEEKKEQATVEENVSEDNTDEKEEVTENASTGDEPTEDAAASVESIHFAADEGLLWPMDGNVIMNYSMDATIYHATLDQYKYNPAIIIAGDVNSKVYSVAKGKIVEISQNGVTGTTMTVDLGDGYQAIYGQLKELNFEEGDYVEAGHVLGYVSQPTKYYSVEGSNLYFELQKDGTPIDPIVYFE